MVERAKASIFLISIPLWAYFAYLRNQCAKAYEGSIDFLVMLINYTIRRHYLKKTSLAATLSVFGPLDEMLDD